MNKNYKAQTIQLTMSWKKQNTKMHQETENNEGVGEDNWKIIITRWAEWNAEKIEKNLGVGKIAENNNCNDVLSEM